MLPDDSLLLGADVAVMRTPASHARRRRLRILHLIHGLTHGGMERVLVDLVRGTDADQFESHVMSLQLGGPLAEELAPVAAVHRSPPLPPSTMLWPRRLARKIREIAPDLVHTHGRVWYKASLAARLAGVRRIIHTDHGRANPDPWIQRGLDRVAARRTDVVVAVSAALASHLRAHVVGAGSRIDVITNGVDTRRYRPRPDDGGVREAFHVPAGAPVIGTVGRFDPIKAYDMMVEAFARLLAEWSDGPAPILMFVGDGLERPVVEAAADRCGVRDSIRITGIVDDVERYHSTLAVFSLSSHSEGTSISLLEAMSAGVCPVVTDAGGNRACLGPALEHRLVPTRNPTALAAAWRSALMDDTRRMSDAAVARARVQLAFGRDHMVEQYAALYAAITSPVAGRARRREVEDA